MTTTIRLGARIRAARKAAGFDTAKDFLKKHKFPASTLSQHESGARIPDDDALKLYCKVFDVSFDWLKTGKGLPYKKSTSEQKGIIEEELSSLVPQRNKTNQTVFNEELLKHILQRLLNSKSYSSKISARLLAKDASKIYKDITSITTAPKMQMKLLKGAFAQATLNKKI